MKIVSKFIQTNLIFFSICSAVFGAYLYSTYSGSRLGDCQKVEKITERSKSGSRGYYGSGGNRFVHK